MATLCAQNTVAPTPSRPSSRSRQDGRARCFPYNKIGGENLEATVATPAAAVAYKRAVVLEIVTSNDRTSEYRDTVQ